MRALIVADSDAHIGEGHGVRMLNLARMLQQRGISVTWVYLNMTDRIQQELAALESEPVVTLQKVPLPEALHQTVANMKPDICVIDGYDYDRSLYETAYVSAKCSVVFDDLANRPIKAHILVDGSLVRKQTDYGRWINDDAQLLVGAEYLVMHPDFSQEHLASIKPAVVHVFFGSTDSGQSTYKALKQLLESKLDVQISVITTALTHDLKAIRELDKQHESLTLIHEPSSLYQSLNGATLALGAPGTATWERMAMGVFPLLYSFNDEQKTILQKLHALGVIHYLGDIDELGHCAEAVSHWLNHPTCGDSMIDGQGCRRVVDAVMEYVQ